LADAIQDDSQFSKDVLSEDCQAPALEPGENDDDDDYRWCTPFAECAEPLHRIVDADAIEAACNQRLARQTSFDDMRRTRSILQALRARGIHRKLAVIPPIWPSVLEHLHRAFPNFEEVIDYIRVMFMLAHCGDGIPRLDPILLDGPPGVGKTMFAQAFAQSLGSGFFCLRMEKSQTNASLSGSAEYWSNTRPGELFSALVERDYANLVVFLDEIDKAQAAGCDPLSSLYSLLEPGTARSFCDLSYPYIQLDASRVIWIATSNDADIVPAPILDRMKIFSIEPPSKDQGRRIVQHIFVELCSEMPTATTDMRVAPAAVRLLSGESPRRIKQLLREGIGRSLLRRSKTVAPRDLDIVQYAEPAERRIGFV
jgi:ATP-dependent Lon protease